MESSISKVYLKEEMMTFCSLYFDKDSKTKFKKKSRNFDNGDLDLPNYLSIFINLDMGMGTNSERYVTNEKYESIMSYILFNYKEVEPYIREIEEEMKIGHVNISAEKLARLIEENIVQWFRI